MEDGQTKNCRVHNRPSYTWWMNKWLSLWTEKVHASCSVRDFNSTCWYCKCCLSGMSTASQMMQVEDLRQDWKSHFTTDLQNTWNLRGYQGIRVEEAFSSESILFHALGKLLVLGGTPSLLDLAECTYPPKPSMSMCSKKIMNDTRK